MTMTKTPPFTTQFLPSLSSRLGILTLNNPNSLNALNLDMIRSMVPTLTAWQERAGGDDGSDGGGGGRRRPENSNVIRATLMVGAPYTTKSGVIKPAFCAGGDVKAVYYAGVQKDNDSHHQLQSNFFREEYQLNHLIATQSSNMPQVSIWDGVVMGGGVGLSVHGKYRVATENTVFAMPGVC
jgi:enoyl-CoA hydratase/carnithine racemase